ncbi:MAG: redoxin domain-containing protein [Deltaproteobacteria bacterium]|nr:redoxin domain-containing protein [Deltaproteobacteria bacterium]
MRLKPGDPAPAFSAVTSRGDTFQLSDVRGHKVWLAFFRYTACMFCNFRIHEMVAQAGELADRMVVAAVFQSPPGPLSDFVIANKVAFPLLSDPEEAVYALYGLETSLAGFLSPRNLPGLVRGLREGYSLTKSHGSRTRIPGDFLISEDGAIATAYYGAAISDGIDLSLVRAFAG